MKIENATVSLHNCHYFNYYIGVILNNIQHNKILNYKRCNLQYFILSYV
jgi:hypothetical protein